MLAHNILSRGFKQMNKKIIFEHDYLIEIKERLSAKANILNVSAIAKSTGLPRAVIVKFCNGEIPNTSFNNIVTLYKYIEEHNI